MKTALSRAFVAVTSRYPQIRFTKYQFNFWRGANAGEEKREGEREGERERGRERERERGRESERQVAEGPLVARADFQSELIKSRADHANLFNFIL